jgi:mannose/cellobiose epimerase-like protein (N-acyl-D-glucosamine 2-epimerase family)
MRLCDRTKLYDSRTQILAEYFKEGCSSIEPLSVELGHQAEWVWLLKGFEWITNRPTGGYRSELLIATM